jgi:hypothetical protein
VHAYQDSQIAKGSVSADVVRTPNDRRFLASLRLDRLIQWRDELNAKIAKLSAELDAK